MDQSRGRFVNEKPKKKGKINKKHSTDSQPISVSGVKRNFWPIIFCQLFCFSE